MTLPKELTTVTPLSKTVALIMFILLPIIGFLFGMQYQSLMIDQAPIINPPVIISPTPKLLGCTMDAKICPGGTAVGRTPPNCEFEKCPEVKADPLFCGGIMGLSCPTGYYCKGEGDYPDAGGTCIKNKDTTQYICPASEYVNCMPGPDVSKTNCSNEFLQWATANCPNFKGAAY